MRFGFCAAYDHYQLIASTGFDYYEGPLAGLLKPESPESEIMPPLLQIAEGQAIKPEAFNVFLPSDLKITGASTEPARQRRYLESAFGRVATLGGSVVVFGSAGARSAPDGFSHAVATSQIVDFLKIAGPIAAAKNVVVVIEPLNQGECNIVNSVAEGTNIVRAVDHPAVQVLSDLYHVDMGSQSYEETRDAGSALRHVHVAGAENRRAPVREDTDYLARFFAVLKQMEYDGRVSVEGNVTRIDRDAPIALEVCRKAWEIA